MALLTGQEVLQQSLKGETDFDFDRVERSTSEIESGISPSRVSAWREFSDGVQEFVRAVDDRSQRYEAYDTGQSDRVAYGLSTAGDTKALATFVFDYLQAFAQKSGQGAFVVDRGVHFPGEGPFMRAQNVKVEVVLRKNTGEAVDAPQIRLVAMKFETPGCLKFRGQRSLPLLEEAFGEAMKARRSHSAGND